jgi:RHS repeat-associated protein
LGAHGCRQCRFADDGVRHLDESQRLTTTDSAGGQRVGITLQYDEFDRETLRRFDLNGVIQELTQAYNDVDGLVQRTLRECVVETYGNDQRTLKEDDGLLRDETYGYDPRGRLISYNCTGPQLPVDPYNKTIIRQTFSFSALDNLRTVITTFEGGSNRAFYTYDAVDPTQLIKVINNHPDYPSEILLKYNKNGHLILDEASRTLDYDPLGRLSRVSGPSGGAPRSYSYTPVDTLAGMNEESGQEQRFYQGDQLANQIKGADSSTFIRGDEVVLAELKAGGDPKSLMLATDHKNSVFSEVGKTGRNDVAYSAYGHRAQDASVSSSLGYNGERREEQTGWYLLGNGYRAFNPVLMRFNSPDSWSPFGEGGLNAYAYCEGDSINNDDPTGHTPLAFFWASVKRNPALNTVNARFDAANASKLFHSGEPVQTPKAAARSRLNKEIAKKPKVPSAKRERAPTPPPDYDSDNDAPIPTRDQAKSPAATLKSTVPHRKDVPVPHPKAEQIAALQAQLKAAKGVRREDLLDQKKIDDLTAKIAKLRTG